MNRRREESDRSGNKRRVLQGYRQEGKRFIPPFLQLTPMTENSWLDDRVPELIWIALLIHVFGLEEGTAIALSIAKAAAQCDQTAKKAFAAASDYVELSDEQRNCIRSALREEKMLDKAGQGLAALIGNYPDCPLAFLSNTDCRKDDSPASTLEDISEVVANISDRQSQLGIYAQAAVVYIFFVNGRLQVAPHVGLANLPAIEEYPNTEESLRVAASVRSAVTGMLTRDIPSDWRHSFWNQGRSLGPCEVE